MESRRVVIVLGMHRSGTSLCANMLSGLGVDMADDPGASPANERGHWERPRINDWHDEILAMFGRQWDSDAHHLALPAAWWEDERVGRIRASLVAWLRPRLENSTLFGFKDPRISRLLAMWPDILDELRADPVFIYCLRNPAQVSRSLAARDELSPGRAEHRWLVYNAAAVHGMGAEPVCIIPYEDWFTAPRDTITRLARWTGTGATLDDAHLAHIVSCTVDRTLRHDGAIARPSLPIASKLHALILACRDTGVFSPDLRLVAETLVEHEQLCLPMLRDAVMLRDGVREQNRVIRELNALIGQMRQGGGETFRRIRAA